MRRLLLVLAVMVIMVLAFAMPAFAGSTQSGQFGSGTTGATLNGPNCIGAGSSQEVSAGNTTGFPGSAANPVQFEGQSTFTGPLTSDFAQNNPQGVSSLQPNSGSLDCPGPGGK